MLPFPAWWPIEHNETDPSAQTGLWAGLQDTLDIKQTRPAQADGIISKEMLDGSGRHFMLKNSRTHTYVRLTPEEFWIWQRMDGINTVQQIVLAYFMEFKSFAFAAVVGLIERLSNQHMLSQPPQHIYAEVADAMQEQSLLYKSTWIARKVFTGEFVIKNLDAHMERIYRNGGWILFTLPVQILFLLLSVVGAGLFVVLARDPRFNLLNLDTALQLGLVSYVIFAIHEFGHAITAKHVGCEVYKGGVMLYYGMPAAFIDTTDVWMFGKRARLSVTWAGPYTGYIIGGTCSILVYCIPTIPDTAAILLLQTALASIFASTLNFLPLLKLDGYYMLADSLEIPRLRERSMEFITSHLRSKISKREKWTREEKIFLVFGIIAFLSTFYFTFWGIAFWDRQATKSVAELFNLQGDFGVLLKNVGIIFLAASTIIYSFMLIAGSAKQVVQWLQSRGLFSTRMRAAAIILISALILTYTPRALLPTLAVWFILLGGISAFTFSAWLAFSNFKEMRGSAHAWMWLTIALGACVGAVSFAGEVNPRWLGAGIRLHEAGIILMLVSFVLAGRLLFGLRGSWRQASLALIALGIVVWAAALFTSIESHVLAGFLILGGLLHWRMRPVIQVNASEQEVIESTHQRMLLVFNEIKATVLSELELDFGKQTRVWVENGSYHLRKNHAGDAEFSASITDMTPNDYGGAMALGLEELLGSVERAAGKKYAWRALAYGYDKLDWELQEIAEDHILKYVRHSVGLSTELSATRDDLGILLHSVPLFISLTEDEISILGRSFKPQHFERGESVVRAGESGDSFYIIHSGRAEVLSASGEGLNTLRRGDYFGEASLLNNAKRNATIRARTPLEVLVLSKYHFDRIIRVNIKFDEKARDEFNRLGVLRQIPLFEDFEGLDLRVLAKILEKVDVAQGQTVFTQGEDGDRFYIIESGKVNVQIDDHERATLGAGEYFGEMALLTNAPRVATIVAAQPTSLLQLWADDFNELIHNSGGAKKAIERASSRRILANRRKTTQTKPLQ